MRMSTNVWLSLWHVGVPGSHKVEGPITVKDAIFRIAGFLKDTSFRGSRMEFRIATTAQGVRYDGPTASEGANVLSQLEDLVIEDEDDE